MQSRFGQHIHKFYVKVCAHAYVAKVLIKNQKDQFNNFKKTSNKPIKPCKSRHRYRAVRVDVYLYVSMCMNINKYFCILLYHQKFSWFSRAYCLCFFAISVIYETFVSFVAYPHLHILSLFWLLFGFCLFGTFDRLRPAQFRWGDLIDSTLNLHPSSDHTVITTTKR